MLKKLAVCVFIILAMTILSGCGGMEQKNNTSSTPKITSNPTEINHQTQYGDPGTWNSMTILVSTFKTVSGKDTPKDGRVRISSASEYIKMYDQDGKLLEAGDDISTKSGIHNLTITYYSQGSPTAIEYSSNIVLQYNSATVIIPVKVQKPQTHSFSITTVPSSIARTSSTDDPGTWNIKNLTIILSADGQAISDTIAFIVPDGMYIKAADASGQLIDNGTIETDSQGRAAIVISYFTQADLSYTDSIELFYGTTSKSIPITITTETPAQVTTRIYPDAFAFKDPAGDAGTWRTAYFNVYTQNSDGDFIGNADISLSASSQYTQILCNGIQQATCNTKTNANGVYNAAVYYYTQTSPVKIEYTSALIANEAIAPITITGDTTANDVYTLNVTPVDYTFTYSENDPGTWRTQYFVVVVNDQNGTLVPDAKITVVSPHAQYTKLFDGNTEIPSPMSARADASGQYNLRVDYFTNADFTSSPILRLSYSGQLVVSHKQYAKTVKFTVQ